MVSSCTSVAPLPIDGFEPALSSWTLDSMPLQAASIEGASVTEFQNCKEPPRSPWTSTHPGQASSLYYFLHTSRHGELIISKRRSAANWWKALSAQVMQTWLWSCLGWTTVILSSCSSYLSGGGSMPHPTPFSKQISTTCSLYPDSQAPVSFPWDLLRND